MYNLFYNLNDRPFGLKPDLKYFYTTRSHKRAILHMRVGFEQPDGVLIFTGEKGLGKTTSITNMLGQLNKSENTVAFIQKPPQKDDDFLPEILSAFQISVTEHQPKVLLNILHKFFLDQARLNKKVLLVVDDAESLSRYCLGFIRLLSTLRLDEHGLLQIVLVGTNELDAALSANENHDLKQAVSMSYCMHPLQGSDTREYIEHRLKVAGWNGVPVIDEDAFGDIHQLTGGVPSAINQYCDCLLMLGMLRKTHHITSKDVSDLTSETMEKLENYEAVKMEQDKRNESLEALFEQPYLSTHSEPKKVVQFQQAVKGMDNEEIIFGAPVKETNKFLNKKTLITIAAAYLISSISIFFYNKMSEIDPGNHIATASTTHSEVNNHSVANQHAPVKGHSGSNNHSVEGASAMSHESGSGSVKYVLEEIPAESSAESKYGSGVSEVELLDIQQLLKKSRVSVSGVNSTHIDESLASDTENYAFGSKADAARKVAAEARSTRQIEHTPRNSLEMASNTE